MPHRRRQLDEPSAALERSGLDTAGDTSSARVFRTCALAVLREMKGSCAIWPLVRPISNHVQHRAIAQVRLDSSDADKSKNPAADRPRAVERVDGHDEGAPHA